MSALPSLHRTLTLALLSAAVACGDEVVIPEQVRPGPVGPGEPLNPKVFVTPEEFAALRSAGALVYDVRGSDAYAAGHVSGALRLDWRAFAIPEKNGIVKESRDELETIARGLGLRARGAVLIYGGWGNDASSNGRVYWTLEYLGHDDVYLLNGTVADLEAAGVPFDASPVTAVPGDFVVTLRPWVRATFPEVVDAVASDRAVIVDTRTAAEFVGEDLRGNPRGGHVPGAINFDWTRVFGPSGRLLPDAELRAAFEALGVLPGKLVVGYCQSGVRSSFFYATLRHLGYPSVRNYDGSSWEWTRQPTAPVERD